MKAYASNGRRIEGPLFLEFEGQAQVDERKGGVMFAGRYFASNGTERIVICRVTREALAAKCGVTEMVSSDQLNCYRIYADEINRRASAKFEGGDVRPLVEMADLISAPQAV
jgi:hypothetical protein